jgi:hypothetical protein
MNRNIFTNRYNFEYRESSIEQYIEIHIFK